MYFQTGVVQCIKLLLWLVFVDCVCLGLVIATLLWYQKMNHQLTRHIFNLSCLISYILTHTHYFSLFLTLFLVRFVFNRNCRSRQSVHAVDEELEWSYAFDVHCNAFFPLLIGTPQSAQRKLPLKCHLFLF